MDWQEGDLDIGGVRIHYHRRGAGRPLVLAHGASDNGRCWGRVAEALEGEYDIVAYDAPITASRCTRRRRDRRRRD
jgi:pimeloyl-ACP methyl ester carboxylesterase